jgi:hypothetical protein
MDTNDKAISLIYDLHREIKILDETVGSLEGMRNRAFKDLEIEKEKNKSLQEKEELASEKLRNYTAMYDKEREVTTRLHNGLDAIINANPLLSQLSCATYNEIVESGIPTLIRQLTVENGKLAAQKSELEDLIERIKKENNNPYLHSLDICKKIAEVIGKFEDDREMKEEEQGSD